VLFRSIIFLRMHKLANLSKWVKDARVHNKSQVDFASLYQYCLVLNASEKGDSLDDDGKSYVNRLRRSGLDCYMFMSSSKKEVFVLLRVPMEKLNAHCDNLDYKLLLDPEKLEEVAKKGFPEFKIAPISITHNPLETNMKPYHHIYAPFKVDVPIELYWRPSDKKHPFREILRDKLALALIESRTPYGDEPLDIDQYIKDEKIKAFFPLHKPMKRDELTKTWLQFNFLPWTEPIDQIKNYFGERIGLYDSFLSHYTTWLMVPAMIGLPLQIIVFLSEDLSAILLPLFSGFICLWSQAMLEYWKQKERYVVLKWGMIGFEATDKDRPEFKGELVKSYVTGRDELYFPSNKLRLKQCQSYLIVAAMMAAVFAALAGIYVLKHYHYLDEIGVVVMSAIEMQIFNFMYDYVAETITGWENHRTETLYVDSLTTKMFIFQFVNAYASFFYVAFIEPAMDECHTVVSILEHESCIGFLSLHMGVFPLLTVISNSVLKIFTPYIMFQLNLRRNGITTEEYKALSRPEQEMLFMPYDNVKANITNYCDVVIQYGYMVLFVTSLPISVTFCFLALLLGCKQDGYLLLRQYQRPRPQGAEDIGMWQTFMTLTSIAGVVTNAGLIVFTMGIPAGYSASSKLWIFIGFIFFCLILQFSTQVLIPEEPKEVQIQLKRTEFLVEKVIHKVEDDVVIEPDKLCVIGEESDDVIATGVVRPFNDSDDSKAANSVQKKAEGNSKGSQYKINQYPTEYKETLLWEADDKI